MKKSIWIALFVLVLGLLATLATSWNFILVDRYDRLSSLVSELRLRSVQLDSPWLNGILGSLGFLLVCAILYIFLHNLLREMKTNQAQSEFLARVTHELKTPLATMELTASLLKDREMNSNPETQKLWELFDSELKRLKNDVSSLLNAARGEAEGFKSQKDLVVLEDWIDIQMPRWRALLGPKHILERVGEKLPYPALIDKKLLGLIVENIVSNAGKFSPDGSRVLFKTEFTSLGSVGKWAIKIEDSGVGFRPRDKRKIFGRFVRLPQKSSMAIPGTGLGLFLSRQAAKSMGLKLYAQSPGPGLGSIFTIEGKLEQPDGPAKVNYSKAQDSYAP